MSGHTTMRRLPDWPARLAAYVHSCHARPFAWGSHDCARFAAGAVAAVTGVQIAMPRWVDLPGAAAALRAERGLCAAADARLPVLPMVALARRGDVVMVRQGARRLMAVCLGAQWAAPGAGGLAYGPMSDAVRGWGVG